jgi:hypothetical protein
VLSDTSMIARPTGVAATGAVGSTAVVASAQYEAQGFAAVGRVGTTLVAIPLTNADVEPEQRLWTVLPAARTASVLHTDRNWVVRPSVQSTAHLDVGQSHVVLPASKTTAPPTPGEITAKK